MSIRRIGTLLLKDLRYGSRSFIFIFALVMPLFLSLVLGLVFGTLFTEQPRLGIYDAGSSRLTDELLAVDFMTVTRFDQEADLMLALESGGVEVGLSLPADFDANLTSSARTDLTFYIWGQTLIRNRAIISAAVSERIVDLTGRETPVSIDIVPVGDREAVPWQQRLLPIVVLMAIFFGGMLVPATSMIEERQKRTLTALTTTPMSMGEVFVSKGLMGALLSMFTGFAILTLNGGWGSNPLLLVVVMALGGVLAASFGIFLGSRVKDIQTLFAINKSMGIILYAPALIALFPDIPQWIARLFPTYYILQPVLDISQRGAGLAEILPDLAILLILTVVLIAVNVLSAERLQVRTA